MSIIGEIAGGATFITGTYYGRKKWKIAKAKQLQELINAENAKAREMQQIKDTLVWVKKQFGESPNGGGIMEQLKDHIAETRQEFADIRVGMANTNIALARMETKQELRSQ